jgi:hypothetical protein
MFTALQRLVGGVGILVAASVVAFAGTPSSPAPVPPLAARVNAVAAR